MTSAEAAAYYGVSRERIRDESLAFLYQEGYMPDGHECHTLAEWFDCVFGGRHREAEDNTPWQKGDDYPE